MSVETAWILGGLFSLGALVSLFCLFAVLDGWLVKPSDPPDPETDDWNAVHNGWAVFFSILFLIFFGGIAAMIVFAGTTFHSPF